MAGEIRDFKAISSSMGQVQDFWGVYTCIVERSEPMCQCKCIPFGSIVLLLFTSMFPIALMVLVVLSYYKFSKTRNLHLPTCVTVLKNKTQNISFLVLYVLTHFRVCFLYLLTFSFISLHRFLHNEYIQFNCNRHTFQCTF